MTKHEFIEWLLKSGWQRESRNIQDNWCWEYEADYANMVTDNACINDNDTVDLSYDDIGWGYTNREHKDHLTFEEFIVAWNSLRDREE